MQAVKQVLIYQDAGVSESSAQAIQMQLSTMLGNKVSIRIVDSNFLRHTAWEKDTSALVMGAGVCSTWEQLLQEDGMRKIYNYVFNGGRYLGICAGAYFGAAYSQFCLIGQAPLIKKRPLSFYIGHAIGPIIATDDELAPQAALALRVELVQNSAIKLGYCYYLGGPTFDILQSSYLTEVLLRYTAPFTGSAAISNTVGFGRAVLCGLHPEFFWPKPQDKYMQPEFFHIAKQLSEHEGFRQEIWNSLVSKLFS